MTDEGDQSPEENGCVSRSAGSAWTAVEAPRSDTQSEWELFLRETPTEPLRHAGSVTAPSAEGAHERATALFPDATTLWCCRAAAVTRVTERDLGSDHRAAEAGGEGA